MISSLNQLNILYILWQYQVNQGLPTLLVDVSLAYLQTCFMNCPVFPLFPVFQDLELGSNPVRLTFENCDTFPEILGSITATFSAPFRLFLKNEGVGTGNL